MSKLLTFYHPFKLGKDRIDCSFNSFDKYSSHCCCITYADIRPIMPVINIFDKRVWNFWDSHPNISKGGHSTDVQYLQIKFVCSLFANKTLMHEADTRMFFWRNVNTILIRVKGMATLCQGKYVHVPLLLHKISCIIYQKAVPVMWQKINTFLKKWRGSLTTLLTWATIPS